MLLSNYFKSSRCTQFLRLRTCDIDRQWTAHTEYEHYELTSIEIQTTSKQIDEILAIIERLCPTAYRALYCL
jgi:hypothetical protein